MEHVPSAIVNRRARVLVVCPSVVGTFIRQDVRLLSPEFDVELFSDRGWGGLPLLYRAVRGAGVVLVWFAGRHAVPTVVLARRARVPVATVIGGYESAWVPEIGYGIPPGSLRERILRRLLAASNAILTVSHFSDHATRARFPNLAGKTRCIRHAIDTAQFRMDPGVTRQSVICVGNFSRTALHVKGWPLFWEVATRMPQIRFVAIGPARDATGREFVASRPANLEWRGALTGDALRREFQTAAVYFQGSRHESFCVALAEAMACGCIPAVSRCGALPEVAGENAFFFDPLSPQEAVLAVEQALAAPEALRTICRERIAELFDLVRRQQELTDAIRMLLTNNHQVRTGSHGT